MKRITCILVLVQLFFFLHVLTCTAEIQSANYRVPIAIFPSGGAMMVSPNYDLYASTGQSSPLGHSFSSNYIFLSGIWHISLVNFVDSDGDSIDDNWEIIHFGNLLTASQSTDFDKDGYTDLQEYLNGLKGETDPQGNVYDPKLFNAPGGTGYNSELGGSILLLVLPAIINGNN